MERMQGQQRKSARNQNDLEKRKVRKPPRKGTGGSADRQRSRWTRRDPRLHRELEVQAVKETIQKGQSPTAKEGPQENARSQGDRLRVNLRPRKKNLCDFKSDCKRRVPGPRKATYISREDTEELSHDQLVDKVLTRMTPGQLETRCTHNNFVLNVQSLNFSALY